MPLKNLVQVFFLCLSISLYSQEKSVQERKIDQFRGNNLDSIAFYANQLLSIGQKSNNDEWVSIALLELGEVALSNKEYDKADSLVNQSIVLFDNLSDHPRLSSYYFVKGKILFSTGYQEEALNFYYKSVEVSSKEEDSYKIYTHIARILQNNRDSKNALDYHKKSIVGAMRNEDWNALVRTYLNLCILYNGKATLNVDSSAYYGRLAIKVSDEKSLKLLNVHAINVTAAPIIRQGLLEEGIEMAKQALAFGREYKLPDRSRYVQYINLGFAYAEQGKLSLASQWLDSSRLMYAAGTDNERLAYTIEKYKGNYQKALDHFEIYNAQYDSVIEQNYEKKFSSLQARLEANQKEKEVNKLQKEATLNELKLRKQRSTIFIIIALLVVLSSLGIAYFFWNKARKERVISTLRQKLLSTQLNPHFMFNSLNAIQQFLLKKEPEEAGKYLGIYSTLMRQILDHSRSEYVTIGEEVAMLTNYLDLQKIRFDYGFHYEIIVDEELDTDYLGIPPLFAQPFVENSLEHGLFKSKGENSIRIYFETISTKAVQLRIEDSGKGIDETKASNSSHTSHATNITEERLAIYKNVLREKIQLAITNIKDQNGGVAGLKVEIALPLKVMLN